MSTSRTRREFLPISYSTEAYRRGHLSLEDVPVSEFGQFFASRVFSTTASVDRPMPAPLNLPSLSVINAPPHLRLWNSHIARIRWELRIAVIAAGETTPNDGMGRALAVNATIQPAAEVITDDKSVWSNEEYAPEQPAARARTHDEGMRPMCEENSSTQTGSGAIAYHEGMRYEAYAPIQPAEVASWRQLSPTAGVFVMPGSIAPVPNEVPHSESSISPNSVAATYTPPRRSDESSGSSPGQRTPGTRAMNDRVPQDRAIGQGSGRGNDGESKRLSRENSGAVMGAGKRADNRGRYGGPGGFEGFGGMGKGTTQGTPFVSRSRDPEQNWRSGENEQHEPARTPQTKRKLSGPNTPHGVVSSTSSQTGRSKYTPQAISPTIARNETPSSSEYPGTPSASGSSISVSHAIPAARLQLEQKNGLKRPGPYVCPAMRQQAPNVNSSTPASNGGPTGRPQSQRGSRSTTTPKSNGLAAEVPQIQSMGSFYHANQAQLERTTTSNSSAAVIAPKLLVRRGEEIEESMIAEFTTPPTPSRTSSPEDVHKLIGSRSSIREHTQAQPSSSYTSVLLRTPVDCQLAPLYLSLLSKQK